jgi:hypothetical protein
LYVDARQRKLDWLIKKDLFWTNMRRQKPDAGPQHGQGQQDPMERIFGTIIPKNIPESSAWWHQQAFALCI